MLGSEKGEISGGFLEEASLEREHAEAFLLLR